MRKLSALAEHAARLRRRRPAQVETLRDDIDLQDALAMSLVVCVQSALDVALHIASDEGYGIPATYSGAFDLLADRGVLMRATSRHLGAMTALRNRIAHGYASVDFARIWQELPAGLAAFDDFAREVAVHLGDASG
ncbi:MAG TPA: DUF86 domain-containing protein [Planctomycetota bacterium]|nr:DUF86 domain-containing protein [Planctomycetota bacterium]